MITFFETSDRIKLKELGQTMFVLLCSLLCSFNGDDDDDEVFVGPVSHKERCVSVGVTSQFEECSSGSPPQISWSPLSGDQMEAVCQEAHRLANQLQSEEPRCEDSQTATDTSAVRNLFVQDSGAKLGLLGQTPQALSPIKRQTFCVQDSPMKQLPPAIQGHLLRGRSSSAASSARPTATSRPSTSSPAARAKAQSRTSLRGRSTLGVCAVLPSKPVAPTASCPANKSKVERSRLQPPSRVRERFLLYLTNILLGTKIANGIFLFCVSDIRVFEAKPVPASPQQG